MDAAEKAGKEIEKMKSKLIAVAALAALTAAAMPTKDEIAQANKEVQASLKKQIAAWQSGDISDGDLAALMLIHAGKFKDEPRHYACLQAAFAAAVRAGDAFLAASAIEKIAADTKNFGYRQENALINKAFEKVDVKKAGDLRRRLMIERAKVVGAKPISDTTAATIALLRLTVIPSVAMKPPATLVDAIEFLRKASKDYAVSNGDGKSVSFISDMDGVQKIPAMPAIAASNVTLYDTLKLIVDSVGFDFKVEGGIVYVFRKIGGGTPEGTSTVKKMKRLMLPSITIKPPATLADAVELLRTLSVQFDFPDSKKKGVEFILKIGKDEKPPAVPRITAKNLLLYDALDLITKATGYAFEVKGDVVIIFKK